MFAVQRLQTLTVSFLCTALSLKAVLARRRCVELPIRPAPQRAVQPPQTYDMHTWTHHVRRAVCLSMMANAHAHRQGLIPVPTRH